MNRSHRMSVSLPGLVCALVLLSGGGFIAQAQDNAPPTEQSSSSSGDVQERGLQRGTFGVPSGNLPVLKPGPVGFYCLQSKGKCYCDRSQTADCDLMKAYVCLPGSYKDTTVLDGECDAKR